MPAHRAPSFLFVPVSGGGGMGEFARCVTLADGVLSRWPDCRVRFVKDRRAPAITDPRIETLEISRSPTFNSSLIKQWMTMEVPDVAIFDNSSRRAQLDRAGRLGVRRVLIASRPSRRRKTLLRRMLSRAEQIWLVEPEARRRRMSHWERFNRWLAGGRCEVVFVEPLFPPSAESRRRELIEQLGLSGTPYVLFSPGGGGWLIGRQPAAEIFIEAAKEVVGRSRLSALVITGPLYDGVLVDAERVLVRRAVDPANLCDLIQGAEIVVLGGGSSLGQAIALRKPIVATAVGGSDQTDRVARYGRQGLLETSRPVVDELADSVLRLWDDPARRDAMRARQADAAIGNGLDKAVTLLADLVRCAAS